MSKSTRTVMLGKTKVVVSNVPDNITDDQLKSLALKKIFLMQREQAQREIHGLGLAS